MPKYEVKIESKGNPEGTLTYTASDFYSVTELLTSIKDLVNPISVVVKPKEEA